MTTLTDLDHIPKHRRDWLGCSGEFYPPPAKVDPRACAACLYGPKWGYAHTESCKAGTSTQ